MAADRIVMDDDRRWPEGLCHGGEWLFLSGQIRTRGLTGRQPGGGGTWLAKNGLVIYIDQSQAQAGGDQTFGPDCAGHCHCPLCTEGPLLTERCCWSAIEHLEGFPFAPAKL